MIIKKRHYKIEKGNTSQWVSLFLHNTEIVIPFSGNPDITKQNNEILINLKLTFVIENQLMFAYIDRLINIINMAKSESVFLKKLNILKESGYLKNDARQAQKTYSSYSTQYLKASKPQKEWMDKNCDYILNKIKTLEKKYWW